MIVRINDFELASEIAGSIRNDCAFWFSAHSTSAVERRTPYSSQHKLAAVLERAKEGNEYRICVIFEIARDACGSSYYVFCSDGVFVAWEDQEYQEDPFVDPKWYNAFVLPDPQLRVDRAVAVSGVSLNLMVVAESIFDKDLFWRLMELEESLLHESNSNHSSIADKAVTGAIEHATGALKSLIDEKCSSGNPVSAALFRYLCAPSETNLVALEEAALLSRL